MRKENISKLSSTKIIIPDCIRRLSNFNDTSQMIHVSAEPNQISVTLGSHNANAIIKGNILEIPEEILSKANMIDAKIFSLYLTDLDTIIILPSVYDEKKNKMNDTHHQFRLEDNCFVVESVSEFLRIPFSSIYYFEKIKATHNTCIIFSGGISTFKSDLREVAEKLDGGFVQCHKAFIANMTRVIKFDKRQNLLLFDSNYSCPCSRIFKRAVIEWKF